MEELLLDANDVNFDQATKSQNVCAESPSESLQWQPFCADIEDGGNTTTECGEHTQPLGCHEKSNLQYEPDREVNRCTRDPSHFEDVDLSARLQPSHVRGLPNAEEYYSKDDEWRAQNSPGGSEEQLLNSPDGDIKFGSSELEPVDFDLFISSSTIFFRDRLIIL